MANMQVRLDNKLKSQFKEVVERQGMDTSSAIRFLMTQVINGNYQFALISDGKQKLSIRELDQDYRQANASENVKVAKNIDEHIQQLLEE